MKTHRLLIAIATLATVPLAVVHGQSPESFVALRVGVTCDRGQNFQIFLRNSSRSRDIKATVKWRVASGTFSTVTLRIPAGAEQQIGCAADANIVGASFLTPPDVPQGGGGRRPPGDRDDAPALQFATLTSGRACDNFGNFAVFLGNTHQRRAIVITIRSRASAGIEQFHTIALGPGRSQQVGCAAQATISAARFR
jgi:hypothetical protein